MSSTKVFIDLSDLLPDTERPFEEIRNEVVFRINSSDWFQANGETRLGELLDELGKTQDDDQFDAVFSKVYDLADAEGVFIQVDDNGPDDQEETVIVDGTEAAEDENEN